MRRQISIFTENRKGAMRSITHLLAEGGIDIDAFVTNDSAEFGIVRMLVSDPDKASALLTEAGYQIKRTPVMAFDDSLSAVDAETDAKIRQALFASRRGATVIFVSHRIQTLMRCDRILVLDHGRVAELGTHGELLARGGIYRRIYDIQMNPEGEEAAHVQ